MPAVNDTKAELNDLNDWLPEDQAVQEELQQRWPAAPPKKSKKKKKGRQYADSQAAAEDEETPFARPIAAFPPDEFQGVSLGDDTDLRYPEEKLLLDDSPTPPEPVVEREPEPPLIEEDEPVPKPIPASTTAARSPKPATAKPVSSNLSPSPRPSQVHSPPQQHALPVGYRPSSSTAMPSQMRRESFNKQPSPRPRYAEPVPPPHMPQPHFYGLPDLGLNFGQKKELNAKAAGSEGYCCCFDSFADSGDVASSKKAKDALLVGSEGGLEVFRVLANKFEVVGRLEGLRGSVIGAKILPHVDLYDPSSTQRPLVAVIMHGLMNIGRTDEAPVIETTSRQYQTTVEVFSLQTQRHITTLYESTTVFGHPPAIGQLASIPAPVGDLRLEANSRYVVVASGNSGEVFVFSNARSYDDVEPEFRCLGKLWTSLQSGIDTPSSRPQSSSESSQPADEAHEKLRVPLLSLSNRWLALVPPTTTSHISVQGSPLLSVANPNPPGLATHVAQPPPQVSCDVVGVDNEDTWQRITRQAAQGVVKYSQKGIDLGWQGWKELTNPTPQPGHQHVRTTSTERENFPPTNALPEDPMRTTREPALVSVVDLDALLEAEESKPKYTPPPLATFALPEGCNLVSFSSSGLRLLTVNRNGMINTIWDLTQVCHGVPSNRLVERDDVVSGPCVKQVYRFVRSSQSVVVDCVWAKNDNALAILTTHGTVHLHEVPARPPSRKRKRRSTPSAPAPVKAEPTTSVSEGFSPPSSNGFLGSLKSGWQQVSTQVNTIRSQNPVSSLGIPTSFAGFKEVTANAGHAGGRALAKGISQGFSAAKGGASDYWHAEDNKIRHKALQDQVTAGCLHWVKKQSDVFLAVVCGGTVHLHPVQRVERRKGDVLVSGLKQDKYGQKHFALPSIRTTRDAKGAQAKKTDDCAAAGPHGFWSLRNLPINDARRIGGQHTRPTPPQVNEVETNPPYCPFHIDARVDAFAFDDTLSGSQAGLMNESEHLNRFHQHGRGEENEKPWIFGELLPPSTKMNTHDYLDTAFHGEGGYNDEVEDMAEQVESRLTIHTAGDDGSEEIRVLTRRTHGSNDKDERRLDMLSDDDNDSEM